MNDKSAANRFSALIPLVAGVLVGVSPACHAEGYGGAAGRNSRGEIVRIDYADDSTFVIRVQKGAGPDRWKERYDLHAECPVFGDKWLKCLPGRNSPLSGTTYRITTSPKWRPCHGSPFFDNTPGFVYVCVKGCGNPRAPKVFRVDPWEC